MVFIFLDEKNVLVLLYSGVVLDCSRLLLVMLRYSVVCLVLMVKLLLLIVFSVRVCVLVRLKFVGEEKLFSVLMWLVIGVLLVLSEVVFVV